MEAIETRQPSDAGDSKQEPAAGVVESFKRIDDFINDKDVQRMINLQVSAINRLESTNRNLIHCNNVAQSKLSATTKLYKKTTKQMKETKRDLDYIYKKILDLKYKIRDERPELFAAARQQFNKESEEDYEQEEVRTRGHVLPSSSRHSQPTDIERKSSRQNS